MGILNKLCGSEVTFLCIIHLVYIVAILYTIAFHYGNWRAKGHVMWILTNQQAAW